MTNIVTIMIRLSFYFLIWLGASCSRPDDEGTSPIKLPANPPKVDITRKLGVLPEFHLMDQGAQAFDHTTFQGKVWVANFIFTRCGSTCPMQTKALVDIQANLRSSATLAEVRLVSFTVDPEYDTPPVLAEYGKSFGADPARWKFVTGTREALWTLSKEGFKLDVGEDAKTVAMPIYHSARMVLVDGHGQIRGYFDGLDEQGLQDLQAAMKVVLEET